MRVCTEQHSGVLWHELSEGIGIQFCGWLVSEKPWTGASDDGTYHSDAGYMDEQKKFQEADKVDGKVIKFRNILDRGYRGNDAAHLMDQLCLQPPSAKSDRRFRGKESIYAGAVARDRSGNERGVRVSMPTGVRHGTTGGETKTKAKAK